ncbi:PAS domain-containing protein [Xanthobacter autotrophicus]|uniref:sensor histidine kinase n=1 Tax=Xanthobacter TaxID=279 RepID=UPI0024ABE458|nr:PAS domain-containing protein [Xanthobacter autotrophicus]MDI4666155.1 PAS domain-containing protein [Xanthobacter autotrophicus]
MTQPTSQPTSTQPGARSFPGSGLALGTETILAPLQRRDLPSFLVAVPSARVIEATQASAALGIIAGTNAPEAVAAVARELSHLTLARFGFARLRLRGSFVPRLFRYAPLALPTGAAVLFADPASFTPPSAGEAAPRPAGAPDIPVALQPLFAQPIRITFETDAEDQIRALSPVFASALGARAGRFLGATFAQLEEDGLLLSHGTAAEAVAGGSFSDVKAFVPASSPEEAALDLSLGGAPVFDAARRRQGIRGFGVLSAATTPPAPARPANPAPPPSAEPEGFGENVVPLRSGTLSPQERSAFREIARTLAAAIEDWPKPRPDAPRADPSQETSPPAGARPAASAVAVPFDAAMPAPSEPEPGSGPGQPAMTDDLDLLDRLPLGLLVQQNGAAAYANRTLLTLTGWEDLADIEAAGGLDAVLVRDGASLHLATAAGARLPVEVRLVAAPFGGRPALVHVIRPLGEAEGREARAITRRDALDMVPWPVFLLEPEGTIRLANRAAAERLGFAAMDLAGEPFTIAVAPEDRATVVAALDRVAAGAASVEVALAVRDRAGTQSPGRAGITRAGADDQMLCVVVGPDSPAGTVAAPPETDRLPHLADRLRQALAAPLACLAGAQPSAALPEPERAAFASVAATLDDLAALATGTDQPTAAPCDLSGLVIATVADAAPSARRRGIALRLDAPDTLMVTTRRAHLSRLARLMLEEALAATPAGASISVSVFKDGEAAACLQVSDGGAGLDEVALAGALDPLAPPAAGDRFAASGLPLRLARLAREAEALGGVFEVRPEPARGLIACLRLPPG